MATKRTNLAGRVATLETIVRALARRLARIESDGTTTRAIVEAVAVRTGEELVEQRGRTAVVVRALSTVSAAVSALAEDADAEAVDPQTVH